MAVKISSTTLSNVKLGSTQIQKIMLGSSLIWENWTIKIGELQKRTWSGSSREGLVYSSGEITLNSAYKIHEFTLFSKVIRTDINGRVPGRFVVYGWDGSTWISLLDTISDNNSEWATYFSRTSNNTSEVSKLKYEFYVYDTIWRSYTSDLRLHVSKWEQKGS